MTVTKSFSIEFDDGVLSYEGWKAPRYEGSKLIAKEINKHFEKRFRPYIIGKVSKNSKKVKLSGKYLGKRKVAVDYGALPPPPATGGRIWVYNKFNESFYQ